MDWQRLAWTAVGTFGASACANTLNQIYEVANDGRMTRTRMRPLPLGRISRLQALAFAAMMGVGGTAILNSQVGCMGSSEGAWCFLRGVETFSAG